MEEINQTAPIVIFAYNRPVHFSKTLSALSECTMAKKSSIYVYLDGPKGATDKKKQEEILRICDLFQPKFGKLTVFQREKNLGLSTNIIDGVSEIVKKFKRIIVLEDDIIVSKSFITFMNIALIHYRNQKNIWHISSYNHLRPHLANPKPFLTQTMNCWGWATWEDRWSHFSKEVKPASQYFSTYYQYIKFNFIYCSDLHSQLRLNYNKSINTWSIYWYVTIFVNNGLCLSPNLSLSTNIGLDGSGQNCEGFDIQPHTACAYETKFTPAEGYRPLSDFAQNVMHHLSRKIYFLTRRLKLISFTS